MNSQLPATEQNYNQKLTENFSVIGEDNSFYTINAPPFLNVYPGLEAHFFNHDGYQIGNGFVTSVSLSSALCKAYPSLSEKPKFVRLSKVWSIRVPPTTLRSSVCFTQPQSPNEKSILNVCCKVPPEHLKGLLSWSLFYLPPEEDGEVKILDGHDYYTKAGLCYYEHLGLWKPGSYRINVQRYHSRSAVLLSEDSQNWSLSQPFNRLSCGGYDDPLSMLIL